jgi:hypothetical protein
LHFLSSGKVDMEANNPALTARAGERSVADESSFHPDVPFNGN